MDYPLCVDLDGALISTNILHEAIIRFLKQNLLHIFLILYWIFKGGRSYLRQRVINRVTLEVSTLPYNLELLAWIKAQKQNSRKIVLVTSMDKRFAYSIANYLTIFNEVIASEEELNLSSHHKEKLLNKQYGEKKYDYIGSLQNIFPTQSLTLKDLYKALRIHQYAKNILLFVPLLSAHIFFDFLLWGKVALGFIGFCSIASSAYLVNDVFDIDADRNHRNKKNRAVASGLLAIGSAIQIAVGLFLLAFICTWSLPLQFKMILLLYYMVTLLYSFYIKNKLLIDVITLAILYTLRIIAGMSLLVNFLFSTWLLLFSLFFFLSLAFLKRISELYLLKEEDKKVVMGRAYQVSHCHTLEIFGISSGLLSILIFALYLNSADAVALYQYPKMLLFVFPILAYWFMRIWLLAVEGKMMDDPILFSICDRTSYYCGFLILLVMFFASK